MSGRAWHAAPDGAHPRSAAHRLADLADTERAARAQDGGRPAFMVVFIGGLVLLGLSLLRGRRPLVTCVVLAALPVWQWLAQLVPWWRWPAALPVLLLAASLATAAAAAAVLRAGSSPPGGPERNVVRLGWTVCGLTAAALTADLLCGGALQLNAVLGNSALIAGRFHGAGNVPAAYLASAALVLAAGAAMLTRRPVLSAAVVGGAAVVLDGAPTFGDDAGGVLALAPAVVLLALIGAGVRVTVRRAVLVVLAGAVPLALFALADYSRPAASRTHLGRFVGQIQDGTAGTVLGRKADAVALGELPAPLRIAIGVAVLGAVVVLLRAGVWRWLRARVADPAYPPGVVGALLLYGLLGTVLNDSGVLVAGAVVGFAMPVLTLVADHTRRGSAAPGGG
jgi:hypothetical protein